MMGRCKRCSQDKPLHTLQELTASCGCVDMYCDTCRARKSDIPCEYGTDLSMTNWLKSLGRAHRDRGGGRYNGRFPCPSRYDDPKVLAFRRSINPECVA